MHSSRMRTARLLPVSPSIHYSGGVPGPRRVYLVGGFTWSLGVYLVPGVHLVLGGCTWSQGVHLVPGVHLVLGGVPGPRGCTWSQGGVPGPRGVPGPGGVPAWGGCTWSQGSVPARAYLPRYPPCEQNDRQV